MRSRRAFLYLLQKFVLVERLIIDNDLPLDIERQCDIAKMTVCLHRVRKFTTAVNHYFIHIILLSAPRHSRTDSARDAAGLFKRSFHY
jgi:hypothetical protein